MLGESRMGVGRQVDISFDCEMEIGRLRMRFGCEKLGDVDVAVNQGSVDPKTMIVKCSNECGRLSGIDIGNCKKSVVLVVVVVESHPFQSSSSVSRLQIQQSPYLNSAEAHPLRFSRIARLKIQ